MRAMIVLCFVIGCSSSGSDEPSTSMPDAPATLPPIDAAADSICGKPGDVGNELGVGQYCASLGDCKKATAPLCSVLGDKNTHFCTKTCKSTDPMTVCGTGAQCVCNSNNQCGCTPSSCLGM